MSEDEQVTLLQVARRLPTRQRLAEAKGLSAHDGQRWRGTRGHCAHEGVYPDGCRASGITRGNGEVCMSALCSSFCEEGPPGTGPLGLCIMVANRTREIRPSGITTGAWGIVRKGSRIEAQRVIAGSATVPCRRMRLRSIQTLRGPSGSNPRGYSQGDIRSAPEYQYQLWHRTELLVFSVIPPGKEFHDRVRKWSA
jgi:hypothetical protein